LDRLIARLKGDEGAVDFLETDPIPARLRDKAVRVLLRELNKDERDWKTFKASYQLGRLKAKEAVPGLLRFLQYDGQGSYSVYKDTASYYQSMAGWALTQIADPASVPQVRRIALDARQRFPARSAAILAYGRLAGPASAADLARVLDEEEAQFEAVAEASWVGEEGGPRLAFPSFNSCREAAAWALADVGDKAGRAALVRYLDSGKRLSGDIATAVHRVDARALDAWSQPRVRSTNEAERKLAVTVRYVFFPQSAGPVARAILAAEQDPLWEATVKFLGRVALNDGEVTRALVGLVANDPGKPNCNRRLKLIDALGRQGPAAATALAEFAEHGRIAR
jgi:HEAT repeat protein